MNYFLCLRTNTVITEKELRVTRARQMALSTDLDNWSPKVYAVGEMRRIYSTPRPPSTSLIGYEEREDGQLYQLWG